MLEISTSRLNMRNKIYIKLWLSLKPYKNPTVTDSYYLKLSNEIKDCFIGAQSLLFLRFIKPKHIDLLACFLTSWFEDVISGIGIWEAFTDMHKQNYGKVLPFYDTDDYIEGEINEQDVAFLIWYFLNTMQQKQFVSPYSDFITNAASEVMEIMEEKYEYAPENNYLKSFYQLDENETNFYVGRELIDTLLFKSWLFYPDTLQELLESEKEIIEESEDHQNLLSFLNDNRDRLIQTAHTRLMALKGKEWAAKIVGDDHPLNSAFNKMSERVQGLFFYKGQNNDVIFLEHVATGKKFEMIQKSFDHSHELINTDTIVFIGLVQYCIEQGKNKLPFFTDGPGALYLRDIDFLLRFWKAGNYHSQPQVTSIGESDQ